MASKARLDFAESGSLTMSAMPLGDDLPGETEFVFQPAALLRVWVASALLPTFAVEPLGSLRSDLYLALFEDQGLSFFAASRSFLGVVFAFAVSHKTRTRHSLDRDTKRIRSVPPEFARSRIDCS